MQSYISEIIPISTVEWMRNTSAIIFFSGCDFRCPYCSRKDIVDFKHEFLQDFLDVKKELKNSANFVDAILFTGGEPCLQKPTLIGLARIAKSLNLKTGIETNGSKPDVIELLLKEGLIDYIALDVKSPFETELFKKVTKSESFFRPINAVIEDVKESLNIIREYENKIDIEIRTTIVPSLIYKKEDILKIAAEIKNIDCKWILQRFIANEEIMEKKFQGISAPSEDFLERIKEMCQKTFPRLRIEIR